LEAEATLLRTSQRRGPPRVRLYAEHRPLSQNSSAPCAAFLRGSCKW
jgi:hypothetical protein